MITPWLALSMLWQGQRPLLPPVAKPAPPGPIPVVTFLDGLSTGVSGYGRPELQPAVWFGQRYESSFMTEVANTRPGEQVSVVTLLLNGGFDRFETTVGRDEKVAGRGPGYVYFEVWGDNRLLIKSDAVGAGRSPGGISARPDQPTRRTPQELSVSVQGVLQLRLLTRYASDLPQRGRGMDHARGGVWANPRLFPTTAYLGKRAADPLRDAFRLAVARLAVSVRSNLANTEPGLRQYPLTVGIAPLRPLESDTETAPEPVVRAAVAELILAVTWNRQSLFRPIERSGGRLLTESFRPNRPEGDDAEALIDIGRKSGAAVVVTGTYKGGPEGKVTLLLVDTRTGWKSAPVEVLISTLRPAGDLPTK